MNDEIFKDSDPLILCFDSSFDSWDSDPLIRSGDFYKSMTTHQDHRTWQDVYHAKVADRVMYVKIQYVTDLKEREGYWVISFKEK